MDKNERGKEKEVTSMRREKIEMWKKVKGCKVGRWGKVWVNEGMGMGILITE